MTPDEVTMLIENANNMKRLHPHLRTGQALMNILFEQHPEVYKEFAGTKADPFYNDAKVDLFIALIQ